MTSIRRIGCLSVACMVLLTFASQPTGAASVSLAQPGGGVAFTFSSGYATGMTAADTLEAHGLHGTFYVSSGLLRQGPWYTAYLSPDEVIALAERGHDVESMTVTQPDLTTVDDARLASELADSQAALESLTGRAVRHVAYPYGAVDARVAAAAAVVYDSGRTLSWSTGDFTASVDAHHLPALLVTRDTSLAAAKSYVDYAVANGVFVVLAFDRITTTPGPYDWTPSDLDALAAYVVASGARGATVAEILTGTPPPVFEGPRGTVVFTFDDGSTTHVDAAATLAARGFRGTFYIISDCARSEADQEMCMTTDQVGALADAGHDVESHTVRHRDLASLKSKELTKELRDSQNTLQKLTGERVRHIAYPYGSHTPAVRAKAAEYYDTGRIFLTNPAPEDLDVRLAQSGTDPMLVAGIGVTDATSLDRAKAYVDYAAQRNVTIVLVFHDIMEPARDAYSWSPGEFAALVDHTAQKGVNVKTMAQAYG